MPGVYYLRHVGFLGAMPPSVKGLRPVELAEQEEGVVEFADFGEHTSASLWRKFREFLIARFGTETADSVAPSWQIETLAEASPAFAEPPPPAQEQHQTLIAENQRLQNVIKQREAADKETERNTRHTDHTAFAEQLVKDGMKPVHCAAVIAALDFAEAPDTPIEFGEGEDRQALSEGLKAIFNELTGAVSFTEQASKDRVGQTPNTPANPLLADAESRTH
ncbi:hypothetical protein [Pseudomonas sp. SLFW]|uniref:hypothetical protein n=1 Tax=Pseudomonas sp. SLFW TaxID=2683259 RepID=UPI002114FD91|nr:hypothetical protein [Pseudomonas sp. SLFW]